MKYLSKTEYIELNYKNTPLIGVKLAVWLSWNGCLCYWCLVRSDLFDGGRCEVILELRHIFPTRPAMEGVPGPDANALEMKYSVQVGESGASCNKCKL